MLLNLVVLFHTGMLHTPLLKYFGHLLTAMVLEINISLQRLKFVVSPNGQIFWFGLLFIASILGMMCFHELDWIGCTYFVGYLMNLVRGLY